MVTGTQATIAENLLREMRHESATTRGLLVLVPPARFDWRPHAKSMTIGGLATHLANIATWTARTLDADELDLATVLGMTWKAPPVWGLPEVLESFDANWRSACDSVAKTSDERMQQEWTLRKGEAVLAKLPRIAALRSFILHHLIHHRGQMTVYLRLLDVPLPPIYGPTADVPI